jgi:alkylation response protein AidB-like acyl-CoA dehydrogenase
MTVSGIPLVDSETTKMLRQTVRDVCAPFGHSYFLEVSRSKNSPRELWSALGDSGLLGVSIPEEFGGGGAGTAELVIVTEEVAASGSPLMLLALSPAVCATTLVAHGSDAQREKWLPGLVSGEDVLAFAITEPDAGSNTHRIRTTAKRNDNGWSLSGSKTYISHVDNAKAILIVAKVWAEDSVTGEDGLGLFLMDVDAPGLTAQEIDVEIISPERQFTLFLDEVRLPADSVVGEPGNGLAALFTGLNPERIASAALLNGIARYALEKGARYASERVVWDVPIGAHQGIAHPLARAHVLLEASRLLTARAAALFDAGLDAGEASNIAKVCASDAASAALDAAIQAHGGNGMATEYGLSTLLGMVRLFRIAPVSTEMSLNHIARKSLGLPKSY